MNRIFLKSMKRASMLTLCVGLLCTMPILAQDNTAPPPPQQETPPPPPPPETPTQPQETMPTPPPPQDQMAPPATPDNNAAPAHGRHAGRMNGDRQLRRMTKQLNLSADQATQIKTIDDDTMKQVEGVRSDSSIAQADKRGKMMDIHKASQDKIRAVLNDDQKTKYDAMLAKHPRRGNRKGGESTPQEPPPAPPQAPQ